MTKGRLEAYSDAVIAIIITIMVLEIKAPHNPSFQALHELWPIFLSYLLSFIYLTIYWNNHHHMLHAAKHIEGRVLWANSHLLFWLSLVPFTTAWMGETSFQTGPVALYGVVLLANALAYTILTYSLIAANGKDSDFAKAIGSDVKGKISIGLYVVGVACSFAAPTVSMILYAVVAIIWLIPDRRFEQTSGI